MLPEGSTLRRDATTFVHPVSARLRTVASLRDGIAFPRRFGLRQVSENSLDQGWRRGLRAQRKPMYQSRIEGSPLIRNAERRNLGEP